MHPISLSSVTNLRGIFVARPYVTYTLPVRIVSWPDQYFYAACCRINSVMSTADIENNRCVLKPLIRKWLKSCTVKSTSECTIQLPDICRSYVACILLTLPTLFYIYAHIIAHILSMHSDIILPILPVCQSVTLWYRCSTKQYAQLLPSSIVQMHHSSFLSPNDATKRKTAHMRVKYTRGCDFRPKSSLSRKTRPTVIIDH